MSLISEITSRIDLETKVRVTCNLSMMGVLTDVGLREEKAWADEEEELLNKLMAASDRLAGYLIEDIRAARAKDAELIQRLVDELQQIADEGHWTPDMHELLNAAAAAGFKPSND